MHTYTEVADYFVLTNMNCIHYRTSNSLSPSQIDNWSSYVCIHYSLEGHLTEGGDQLMKGRRRVVLCLQIRNGHNTCLERGGVLRRRDAPPPSYDGGLCLACLPCSVRSWGKKYKKLWMLELVLKWQYFDKAMETIGVNWGSTGVWEGYTLCCS